MANIFDFKTELTRLDEKILIVWRLKGVVKTLVFAFLSAIMYCFNFQLPQLFEYQQLVLTACFAVLALFCFVYSTLVYPTLHYAFCCYGMTRDAVEIRKGVVIRDRIVIPFIRVQQVKQVQGPIQQLFGLSTLWLDTASGSFDIPGIKKEDAQDFADRVTHAVEIAREDL